MTSGLAIEVRGLVKSYPGRGGGNPVEVLDGLSLDIRRGEFISILGPSGCGKSTLFSLLTGIDQPDEGEILIDGAPAGPAGQRPLAWMPQSDSLVPWRDVLGNVALGAEVAAGASKAAAESRAAELIEEFGLGGFGRARPFQLSGGMRQRAALARTVAQGREVLLLDEPFGALDALTRTALQVWLEEVRSRENWTVALITHDVREAVMLSDRIYVLGDSPAGVVLELDVPLARPRGIETMTSPQAIALERQLLEALHASNAIGAVE